MQKYLNFKFRVDGEVGQHIVCANILCSFSTDNTSNFLIVLLRPTIENHKATSSQTIFTW
jgi:hypothetical protein